MGSNDLSDDEMIATECLLSLSQKLLIFDETAVNLSNSTASGTRALLDCCNTCDGKRRKLNPESINDAQEDVGFKKGRRRQTKSTDLRLKSIELPAGLRDYLATKGDISDLKLVIEKELTETDLNLQQSRFSMPLLKLVHGDFLTEEDKAKLDTKESIPVTLITPCLDEENLRLNKTEMRNEKESRSSLSYRLLSGWTSVLKNPMNELESHRPVHVWSFRLKGDLWFLMLKYPYEPRISSLTSCIQQAAAVARVKKDNRSLQ